MQIYAVVRVGGQYEEAAIDYDKIPRFLRFPPIIFRSCNPGDSVKPYRVELSFNNLSLTN